MSIAAERLMVEVQADVRQALAKMDQVERRSATMATRVGRLGRSMGLAFGGAAVVGGITKTIGLAMDFDQTIRQVGVQTDLSGRKLGKMSQLALKMGKDTIYSAQQSGQAMLELAKGGLTSATIRGGALEQTLRLAAAGGLELDAAAGIMVQGLNTYHLKAKQAVQVTTALAGGANASSVSVDDLRMSLSQVGPGAVNAGMSIQETVAALAAFGNAGIKGSDAGTTLKTMLAALTPSTTKARDAMKEYGLEFVKRNGDFKSMAQVAQELKDGLGDLSQAERSAALKTIFGSDATRAATVLMNEGSKGVRKYIKATKDQSKTQQMANAAMEGAKGAWENFKGSVETAAIVLGTKMLPSFTKAAKKGADFIDDVLSWGPQIEESFGWTLDVGKQVVAAFGPIVDLARDAGQVWGGLSQPVKETSIQVGLAIALWPRLSAMAASGAASVSGAFTTMSAKAKQFAADMTYAETRTTRLGSAARTAAGIGGMVALTKASGETSKGMGVLEGAAAGALMGFSVGGPWGAAIGAGAGALWKLSTNTDKAAMSMEDAKGIAMDYASSLDQITGATTRATRAMVAQELQQAGVFKSGTILGINQRDLVSAAMGQEAAQKRVNAVLADADQYLRRMGKAGLLTSGMYNKLGPNIGHVRSYLQSLSPEIRKAIRDTRETGQATLSYREALKSLPKKAVTKLEAKDWKATYSSVKKLKAQYELTPKQVETLVKALNVDVTKRQMKELTGQAKKFGDMKPWLHANVDDTVAKRKMAALKEEARKWDFLRADATAGVNDQASPKLAGILGRLNQIDGRHASASVTVTQTVRRIGRAIGGVDLPQFDSGGWTGGRSARDVAGVVHGREYVMDAETTKNALPLLKAIHAAKGRVYGYAAGGLAGDPPGAPGKTAAQRASEAKQRAEQRRRELKDFLRKLGRTIVQANGHIGKVFDQLDRLIRKNMSGAKESTWLKKSSQAQERLARITERQTAVEKRLADAQEKLTNVRQAKGSFIDSVREGMAGQATVLNAGNTASAIRQSLGVQVAKVKKFASMLKKLRKMGYSNAIVKQVALAGVEGGYNAALALIGADAATQADINKDFATIRRIGGSEARALGAEMYDASIQAAEGLVKGLKQRRKDVRDLLMDVAMAMQDALRKALGIKPGRGGNGNGGNGGGNNRPSAYGKVTSVAALQGGLRAGSSVTFNFVTHNPLPESQSQTTNKALAKVASLSLV